MKPQSKFRTSVGVSTSVGMVATRSMVLLLDHMQLFNDDPETEAVIMIGKLEDHRRPKQRPG